MILAKQYFWNVFPTESLRFLNKIIVLMQRITQNDTLQQIQLSYASKNHQQKLVQMNSPKSLIPRFSWRPSATKVCIALSLIGMFMIIFLSQNRQQIHPSLTVKQSLPFQLYVYCPYSYLDQLKKSRQSLNVDNAGQGFKYPIELQRSSLKLGEGQDDQQGYDWNHTYVVEMQSNANGSLSYCGLATYFNSTCERYVEYRCSSPGPIFDLKVNQHVDIVWVNSLNPKYFVKGQCMNSNDTRCTLDAKLASQKKMTYTDPTDRMHEAFSTIPITSKNWPTSTHVHGAEVRPTFDGNPLSWIDNKGNRGFGAFSLSDKCYYKSFDNVDMNNNYYLPANIIVKDIKNNYALSTTKINRYPNIQNPGNLWYHDHSMKLSFHNVNNGLTGSYILRDSKVQQEIGVHRSNQRLVMMTTSGWKTQTLSLQTDTVYRFRIVNNNPGIPHIYKLSFVYGSNCLSDELIPFTLIGADSSLFHEGIYNQTSFVLSQAQRIQLLILFKKGSTVYSICADNSVKANPNDPLSKSGRNLQNNKLITDKRNINLNKRTSINNVVLSVPYTDFAKKSRLVSVKRMRPLINLNGVMTINGRASYHMGKSQNPIIGSYQDWYLINTMPFRHPIHVHLINFQVVKILTLRLVSTCTLYELDFMVEAILKGSAHKNNRTIFMDRKDVRRINYTALCLAKKEVYDSPGFHNLLAQVNIENIKDANNVSGIDVQKPLSNRDRDLFEDLNIPIPPTQTYKYITNQSNTIKPHYKRWKDTALLQANKVTVYRIRWAKSSYRDGTDDEYFNVPLDQLREYPGYVYHCHILPDEDNEMMRPIMLQLPQDAQLDPQTPCNSDEDISWSAKVKCLNEEQCQSKEK